MRRAGVRFKIATRKERRMLDSAGTVHRSAAARGGFAISSRVVDERTCVVSLDGEIDLAAAPTLKVALLELLRERHTRFVVDLSLVRHIDSTGLGVLVGLRKRLADDGVVVIAAVPRNALRVFQVTGLDARFEIFSTVDRALAHATDSSMGTPGPC
jgi:anti-sigma B factor antagonist